MPAGDILFVRKYGGADPVVMALHGGPAGVGGAAPLARGLSDSFSVFEPWQRGSGSESLTVARHVADLHTVIETYCPGRRPALVGESWGAMLALAYAAAHPDRVGPLALVGCGTFDPICRTLLGKTREERKTPAHYQRLAQLKEEVSDPAERLLKEHELSGFIDNYDPIPIAVAGDETIPPFDLRAHVETMADIIHTQEIGIYPAVFTAITSPVIMLHGVYDPHPGRMIQATLSRYIPHLEYHEWECCGHSPWLERAVHDDFFATLKSWLLRNV